MSDRLHPLCTSCCVNIYWHYSNRCCPSKRECRFSNSVIIQSRRRGITVLGYAISFSLWEECEEKKKKRWLFLSGYTCGRRREMRRRHDPTRWGGCHGLSVSNHLKGEGWEDESCSGVWCFRIRQHTCAWWRFKILSKHLTQHRWQKNWHSVPQYTHRYTCLRKYSVVL